MYDAHGDAGIAALEAGQDVPVPPFRERRDGAAHPHPSTHSTHSNAAAEDPEAKLNETRRRAFETFRAAFGHNPVVDLPRDQDPYTQPLPVPRAGEQVHNMASQRGGGGFDDLQRQRLDDMFRDMDLGSGTSAKPEQPRHRESAAPPQRATTQSYGGSMGGSSGRSGALPRGRYAGEGWAME